MMAGVKSRNKILFFRATNVCFESAASDIFLSMIRIPGRAIRLCDGWSRRDILRAGALGGFGLGLPGLLHASGKQSAKADACILIFCWGAPSQFESFDPKPDAPAGIRGEFGVIRTSVPGTIVSEHIPLMAQRAHRYAIIRTCAQSSTHHQSAGYEALTGYPPSRDAVALTATPGDHPNLGSIVARMAPPRSDLPGFVTLPQLISDVGNLTPGQSAGFLGRRFDPLAITHDPNLPDFRTDDLTLCSDVPEHRLQERRSLLGIVDRQIQRLSATAEARTLDTYEDRAVRLLTSQSVRRAFDLAREPAHLRDRYGRHTFGQSCLLARRLVEAGVRLVTVFSAQSGKTPQDAWDTHTDNFRRHKDELLPPMDQGTSALLDDLEQRGLAGRTLLVWMGEFGRTPRINAKAGRDHWANCYTILMSGGGSRAGQLYGQSDRHGAFPLHGRVFTPADICATVYDSLGINPHAEVTDALGKPVPLTRGQVMRELF
jgi:uncharacterized protein (DUF1501 family)